MQYSQNDPEIHIFCQMQDIFTFEDVIEYVLSFQVGGFGCLRLCHPYGTQLAIMINGNQIYPHFFPIGNHPGWRIAVAADADWEIDIEFRTDNNNPISIPLALVVNVERAIEIIRQYWEDGEMPQAEEWAGLSAGKLSSPAGAIRWIS